MPKSRLGRALGVLSLLAIATTCFAAASEPPPLPDGLYAEFVTPKGTWIAELEYRRAPLTVTSFVGLAEGTLGPMPGKPYFNGLTFHRVVPGFVIQGGDPLGTGVGGPGYSFQDEFDPALKHDAAGILSMANAGPDTNGSQFFFTLAPANRLNFLHSVFGHIVRGEEFPAMIEEGDTMEVHILRYGSAAKAFAPTPESMAALKAKTPKAIPPHLHDLEGLLPTTPPWEQTLNRKLLNVERFTGAQIYIRLYPEPDPVDKGTAPDIMARKVATELGQLDNGVVAVYYADSQSWGIWVGPKWQAQFIPDGKDQHEAQQDLFAAARQHGETAAETQRKAGREVTAAQALKLELDGVIDGLLDRVLTAKTHARP